MKDTATVAPKTVTEISEGKHEPPKEKKERKRSKVKKPTKRVHKTTVFPEIWEKAKDLADGDMLRVEVRSSEEVIVWNHRNWKKQRNVRSKVN